MKRKYPQQQQQQQPSCCPPPPPQLSHYYNYYYPGHSLNYPPSYPADYYPGCLTNYLETSLNNEPTAPPPQQGYNHHHKNIDLNKHYAITGERPQNFVLCPTPEQIRQSNPTRDMLIHAKEELVRKSAAEPVVLSCDGLRGCSVAKVLSPGSRFDVVYVLPPPPDWTAEDVARLDLGGAAVMEKPSFLFLWSGSSCEEVERGRTLLCEWGFRRAEDICWVKTNKSKSDKSGPKLASGNEDGFLVHTVEHCLVGIKGTVLRDSDGHIVDANMDTDVIVSEERPSEEMYRRIERFCVRERRLVLFEPEKGRPGWVTVLNK